MRCVFPAKIQTKMFVLRLNDVFSKTTGNRSAVWSESLPRAALDSIMKAHIDLSDQRQPSEPGAKEAGPRAASK